MSYSGAQTAKTSRENLGRALAALQADPNIPQDVMNVVQNVAQAMAALFEAERAGGEPEGKAAVKRALGVVGQTLALLQDVRGELPALQIATATIAQTMSALYPLTTQPSMRPPAMPPPGGGGAPMMGQPAPTFGQRPAAVAPAPGQQYAPGVAPVAAFATTQPQQQSPYPQGYPQPPQQAYQSPPQQAYQPPPQQAYQPPPQQAYQPPPQQAYQPPPQHAYQPPPQQPAFQAPQPPSFQPPQPQQPAFSSPQQPAFQPPAANPYAAPAPAPAAAPAYKPPQQPQAMGSKERIPVEVNIGATTDSNFYVGFSGEISEGGVFCATYSIQPRGTLMRVLVTLPGNFEKHVNGTVRFVRDPMDLTAESEPGMGIQFEGLDPEARELILRFIRKRAPMFYDE